MGMQTILPITVTSQLYIDGDRVLRCEQTFSDSGHRQEWVFHFTGSVPLHSCDNFDNFTWRPIPLSLPPLSVNKLLNEYQRWLQMWLLYLNLVISRAFGSCLFHLLFSRILNGSCILTAKFGCRTGSVSEVFPLWALFANCTKEYYTTQKLNSKVRLTLMERNLRC